MRKNREQEAVDKLFQNFQRRMDNIREIMDDFVILGWHKKYLNVAIILNNKVVELLHFFKSRGIKFLTESSFSFLILSQLLKYYRLAYNNLKLALETDKNFFEDKDFIDEERIENYVTTFMNFIKEYTNICNIIYNYSIEKNLVDYIVERYNNSENKIEANEMVKQYQQEFISLGYENLAKELQTKFKNEINNIDYER